MESLGTGEEGMADGCGTPWCHPKCESRSCGESSRGDQAVSLNCSGHFYSLFVIGGAEEAPLKMQLC